MQQCRALPKPRCRSSSRSGSGKRAGSRIVREQGAVGSVGHAGPRVRRRSQRQAGRDLAADEAGTEDRPRPRRAVRGGRRRVVDRDLVAPRHEALRRRVAARGVGLARFGSTTTRIRDFPRPAWRTPGGRPTAVPPGSGRAAARRAARRSTRRALVTSTRGFVRVCGFYQQIILAFSVAANLRIGHPIPVILRACRDG